MSRERKDGLPRWVYPNPGGNYRCEVRVKGRKYYLGAFDTPEEAHERGKQFRARFPVKRVAAVNIDDMDFPELEEEYAPQS